ncbi:homocysteine S-methyltransferase [Ilumatobacter fluminis]|uniref:Homocysteine S-methyltransferase n=1 Tax=Ilumatobacter fluminis TaxID=467091 RepID=A0A4R7I612_9ACTN|nr:homocysteine S-methyltransferase family protein [Ilumatobacter fluminis]TDT18173.1 homocysteine S-methyltransferase [Ilumatobacter fluminis]
MALTSHPLQSLRSTGFITDGGMETSLIFLQGLDLPCFAAFPLLDDEAGRTALAEYYAPYLVVATDRGLGMMLDTPTWRANPDWASLVGYDRDALDRVNRDAVAFVQQIAGSLEGHPVVVNGAIGPRGDGYVVGSTMTVAEATNYHALQVRALSEAGVDLVTATTMNYVEEALGVAQACEDVGVPFAIGFTVETDGCLPSGQSLRSAIEQVDAETAPEYFMVNCAHPTHFSHVFGEGGSWLTRIAAVRSNASTASHAELDEADELDRGDIPGLLDEYVALRSVLPELRVVGGCCGTDHEHIAEISRALLIDA